MLSPHPLQRRCFTLLVMPMYFCTLASTPYMSDEVLEREMRRMVKALEWVHSKGYVHMDVKVSQVRVS